MNIRRTTELIRFDTGISMADYADSPAGMEAGGGSQSSLLPGSTTVSQAIARIFPEGQSVEGEIMSALVMGNNAFLRTPHGFKETARRTLENLRAKKRPAAQKAVRELEDLMDDTEVFEQYRAALLET